MGKLNKLPFVFKGEAVEDQAVRRTTNTTSTRLGYKYANMLV